MENNKNKKSVKFQGDMLIFCDFIQVFVFTPNHHLNRLGGLSLPRKSVVRLTDRPDMTLDVYRGRKTTMQQIRGQDFKILLSTVTPTGALVKTFNKSKTINIRGKLQALVLTTG